MTDFTKLMWNTKQALHFELGQVEQRANQPPDLLNMFINPSSLLQLKSNLDNVYIAKLRTYS